MSEENRNEILKTLTEKEKKNIKRSVNIVVLLNVVLIILLWISILK